MEKPKTLKEYLESLKIYLFPTLSLLVVLLLFNLVVKGKILEIFKTREEIKTRREKLSRLIEKQTALSAMDETSLKEEFLLSNEALPSKRDVPGFLAQVERLALETGLVVEGVTLEGGEIATESGEREVKEKQPSAQKESEDRFTSKVAVKGGVENIRDFTRLLLASRRIVEIKKVEMKAPFSQIATPSAMTATLTVEVFFKPLPETMGIAEAPLPQITQKERDVYEQVALYSFLSQPLALPGVELVATPGARLSPFGP